VLGIVPGLDFVLQDAIEPRQAAAGAGKVDALPWSRLRQVDIDLDVHVDVVQGVHVRGGPLDLRLVDRAGRLEFGPFKLEFPDGALTLDGVANSNHEPPSLEVKGHGERLPVRELAAYGSLRSAGLAGELNVNYDLRAQGHSLPELRAKLSGELRTVVEHGRFPLRSLDLLSGDLLDWLGTWAARDSQTGVPCAVADLHVEGGVAKVKTLYLKTDDSAAYGTGNLDLRNDSVDLVIMPKVTGGSLSPPTTVRVRGPLASPQLNVANPGAVALHYGLEVAVDVEFPPAILLRRLFSRSPSKSPSPCR
jgi:uncharacterized protein involved in outer membrane biogenesis